MHILILVQKIIFYCHLGCFFISFVGFVTAIELICSTPGLLGSIHLCRRLPHQQSIKEEEEEEEEEYENEQPFLEVHQGLGMDAIGNH